MDENRGRIPSHAVPGDRPHLPLGVPGPPQADCLKLVRMAKLVLGQAGEAPVTIRT